MVETAGPRTGAQVARNSWSPPRALDTSASHPGHHEGLWTRTQVTRESWSTPRDFGPGLESPRTSGRPHEGSGTVPIGSGHLVDSSGPREWDRVTQEAWSTLRHIRPGLQSPGTAKSPRDIGHRRESHGTSGRSRAVGPGPDSPGTAGRHRGLSDPSVRCPGQLFDTGGPRALSRVDRDS